MKTKLLFLVLGAVAIGVALVHYYRGQPDGDGYSVGDVLANPRPLIGREITVSGVAGDSLSVFGAGYFQLKDIKGDGGSALIAVSSQGTPRTGMKVTVRGTLHQVFASGSREQLILDESPQQPPEDHSTAN